MQTFAQVVEAIVRKIPLGTSVKLHVIKYKVLLPGKMFHFSHFSFSVQKQKTWIPGRNKKRLDLVAMEERFVFSGKNCATTTQQFSSWYNLFEFEMYHHWKVEKSKSVSFEIVWPLLWVPTCVFRKKFLCDTSLQPRNIFAASYVSANHKHTKQAFLCHLDAGLIVTTGDMLLFVSWTQCMHSCALRRLQSTCLPPVVQHTSSLLV